MNRIDAYRNALKSLLEDLNKEYHPGIATHTVVWDTTTGEVGTTTNIPDIKERITLLNQVVDEYQEKLDADQSKDPSREE